MLRLKVIVWRCGYYKYKGIIIIVLIVECSHAKPRMIMVDNGNNYDDYIYQQPEIRTAHIVRR